MMVPDAGDVPYHQPHLGLGMMPQSAFSQQVQPSYYTDTSLGSNPELMLAQAAHGLPQAHYHVPVTSGPHFTGAGDPYMNMIAPDVEAFPDFQTNSLGIQDASGPPMAYNNGMVNPSMQTMPQPMPQYNHQGSASPYSRSPQHGQMHYYAQ